MKPPRESKIPKVMISGDSTNPPIIHHMMLCDWPHERVISCGISSKGALWNRCALQCDSQYVIITQEFIRPTRRQLEIFYGLFEQGFYFVIGDGQDFFGFKKQLLQQVGSFDESLGIADMVFRLWEGNYAIADVPMGTSTGSKSIWGDDEEKKKTLQKWDTRREICERTKSDPQYGYNFGEGSNTKRLPWSFSRFGGSTKFFSEVLLPRSGEIYEPELAKRAIQKASREFLVK